MRLNFLCFHFEDIYICWHISNLQDLFSVFPFEYDFTCSEYFIILDLNLDSYFVKSLYIYITGLQTWKIAKIFRQCAVNLFLLHKSNIILCQPELCAITGTTLYLNYAVSPVQLCTWTMRYHRYNFVPELCTINFVTS